MLFDRKRTVKREQTVIEKVEAKNPLVRQFGVAKFNADKYHKQMLEEQDLEQLKQTLQQLKDGAKGVESEIGAYLFDNYLCFLKTKDSLTEL